MKNIKYIIAGTALLFGLSSCVNDDFMLYDTNRPAGLQFGPKYEDLYKGTQKLADTVKTYSFSYEDVSVVEDTVYFDIYAVGGFADKDRAFSLQQVQVAGANNAVAGTHYKAFTDPSVSQHYVLKAGEVHMLVPIVMLRDISLKAAPVLLKVQVAANENFQPGEPTLTWRKLEFSDRLIKPSKWQTYSSTFGIYSTVKHQLMIDATHQKWDDTFINMVGPDNISLQYWMDIARAALNDYNSTHPGSPLKDENNVLVAFPN